MDIEAMVLPEPRMCGCRPNATSPQDCGVHPYWLRAPIQYKTCMPIWLRCVLGVCIGFQITSNAGYFRWSEIYLA